MIVTKLGDHEVPVVSQKIGYLSNKLGDQLGDVMTSTVGEGSTGQVLGSQAYNVLIVMIPKLKKLMPEYEFLGFGSKEALDAGEWVEEDDHSPTVEEIIDAFKAVSKVHGGDLFKSLKDLMGPTLVEKWMATGSVALLRRLPSSQPTNGGSPSTSSGTTPPTSSENAASPSLA